MKSAFIVILYKTPKKDIDRIKNEVNNLELQNYRLVFIDNSRNNLGYAGAINKAIKKLKKYNADVYIVCNDDISLKQLNSRKIFEAGNYFDIWGFPLKQKNQKYYGGELDKLRLSGGLVIKKPKKRFKEVDFVSGSLMFIKKRVVDNIGLFDESYFLYYEEVDYCTRAKKAGFSVGIDTDLIYSHYENVNRNDLKDFYLRRSRFKYLLKYGSLKQKAYELIRFPKTLFEDKKSISFNFLSLNLSSFINRIINFFLFLILIRVLSVDNYGIYTLVWAHINIFSPLADFGTTTYGIVKLPVEQNKRFNYFYSLRITSSAVALITSIGLALILKLNLFIVLLILFTSPTIIANALSGSYLIILSLKNKQYLSSIVSVLFNLTLFLVFSIVLITTKSLFYLFLSILCLYSVYALLNYFLIKKEFISLKFIYDFKIWRNIIRNSFVFVLISLLAGLYFRLDIYLLNFLKDAKAVGVYSAGYKFFEALIFISVSYTIATLPTLSKIYKSSKDVFKSKIKRDFAIITTTGYIIAVIGYIIAPYMLPFILKNAYSSSIDVFRIVIFALPALFGTTVILNGIYILKKAYLIICVFAFQTIFNFILNVIYIPKYSFIASSYITVVGEILTTIIVVFIFIKHFKYANRD